MEARYEQLGNEWLDLTTGELLDIIQVPDEDKDEDEEANTIYASLGMGSTMTTSHIYA